MQVCSECRTEKPLDQYYDRVKWQRGKHRWCKQCMCYDRWVRKVLAASHPKEDNQACYLCGDTTRRLEVEHSHTRAQNDPRDSWLGVPSMQLATTTQTWPFFCSRAGRGDGLSSTRRRVAVTTWSRNFEPTRWHPFCGSHLVVTTRWRPFCGPHLVDRRRTTVLTFVKKSRNTQGAPGKW